MVSSELGVFPRAAGFTFPLSDFFCSWLSVCSLLAVVLLLAARVLLVFRVRVYLKLEYLSSI